MKKSLLILLFVSTLCSCSLFEGEFGYSEDLSMYSYKGVPLINFDGLSQERQLIDIRSGYSNGGMFQTTWSRHAVDISNGCANVSLYDENGKNYGGEVQTYQGYLYGYFGARMKTFKKEGTVQSIFTYNGWNYEHDEIDIEFLGKDTTKVQFNYYDNGVGGHEYVYDLGFDSSLDYHDYGFLWGPEEIVWFVDFVPVYRTKAKLEQWGFFYINVWAGNDDMPSIKNWLGEYESDGNRYTASYDYLSYAPLDATAE